MEFKKNSWHAWLYKSTFWGLTESGCLYAKRMLLILLLMPITWAGYCLAPVREGKSLFLNFLMTFIAYSFMLACVELGSGILKTEPAGLLEAIMSFFVGAGALVGISALIGSIGVGISLLIIAAKNEWDSYKEEQSHTLKEPKKKYLVVEWYKGFRDKYCPKINWK